MRLVTRGDLDGVVSAVQITTMEPVDSLELIHPQDITDGKFDVREGDILANLPYHPACAMWFDHHELTDSNRKPPEVYRGKHALMPSVARVVFEYYRSGKLRRYEPLIVETDRFDSAQLSVEDISNPQGAILLGFTIDPRTGLGIDKGIFLVLVELLKTSNIDAVLATPEISRRVRLCKENDLKALQALQDHSWTDGNVIVTDFRTVEKPPVGNRFLIYLIYPECNVSVRLQWGPRKESIAVTVGHSIIRRTCKTDIGRLCSDFGGGGHRGSGACTLLPAEADNKLEELIRRLRER
jgi:hypothetical protein